MRHFYKFTLFNLYIQYNYIAFLLISLEDHTIYSSFISSGYIKKNYILILDTMNMVLTLVIKPLALYCEDSEAGYNYINRSQIQVHSH